MFLFKQAGDLKQFIKQIVSVLVSFRFFCVFVFIVQFFHLLLWCTGYYSQLNCEMELFQHKLYTLVNTTDFSEYWVTRPIFCDQNKTLYLKRLRVIRLSRFLLLNFNESMSKGFDLIPFKKNINEHLVTWFLWTQEWVQLLGWGGFCGSLYSWQ